MGRNLFVSSWYFTTVGIFLGWLLPVFAGMCVSMCMYLHVCVCMLSLSTSLACIGPLVHGNNHHTPKTPSCGPASGGTHSGHPLACARLLYTPIPDFPVPPLDSIFFLEKSVFGRVLPVPCQTGQKMAKSPSHEHSTECNSVY
jgi:hypothetical protein